MTKEIYKGKAILDRTVGVEVPSLNAQFPSVIFARRAIDLALIPWPKHRPLAPGFMRREQAE